MTNKDRADRAARVIAAHQGDDAEFYLHDLICDLGHWLDHHGHLDAGENGTLDVACDRGIQSYLDERDGEE